jgi:acetyl-CoA carboxylase biotin carboxylase subunit
MAIRRVFVANRGEIAVRIVRACHDLGLEAIAAYSEADSESLAVRLADGAAHVGGSRPNESYLVADNLVHAALTHGCDALHPGYGFLSESPLLAQKCLEAGIIFIGPQPEIISLMGNKLGARAMAKDLGLPVVPGSPRVREWREIKTLGDRIGYPLMIKAAAGGGGRGIKIIRKESEIESSVIAASAEAMAAFGDDTLFVERFIEDGRHIEVQILADVSGCVLHLGERDCSLQRRYQKLVEEAPAANLSKQLRDRIRQSAVELAMKVEYKNAGTVEFIVDQESEEFYFLEMNTRIQVEHPVSELITGIDLLQAQILIAQGDRMPFSQREIDFSGHAIEVRITAEDAGTGFRPSPGVISRWIVPQGDGLRVDTFCHEGATVSPFYDSLLAKLIVHAPSRINALMKLQKALNEFEVDGVTTTIPFLRRLVTQLDFVKGDYNTRWLEQNLSGLID